MQPVLENSAFAHQCLPLSTGNCESANWKKGLEGGSPQACWREDNSEHFLHFLDTNHAWPKFQAFAISSPCAGCQTVLVKVPALTTSHCKHIHVQEALQSFMVRVGLWTGFLLARLKVSHQFLQLGACFLRRQHLLSQTPVLLDQALHCFFLFLVAYLQAWRDKLGKHLLKGKGQGCTETAEDKQYKVEHGSDWFWYKNNKAQLNIDWTWHSSLWKSAFTQYDCFNNGKPLSKKAVQQNLLSGEVPLPKSIKSVGRTCLPIVPGCCNVAS